jgi:hypothetical protein
MIKKYSKFLLLAICFFLMLPLAARADVLFEPNNDFYTRHRNECVVLGRQFYANGEIGYVSLSAEPGSKDEGDIIENGEILDIMFTYNHNGETWGVTEIYSPDKSYDEWSNGWIPMDQLLLVYDFISFDEEHQNEYYHYDGTFKETDEATEIVFWTWPGSGVERSAYMDEAWIADISGAIDRYKIYKDEEGREWGFISYLYAIRNVWVCISDPSNHDIPAFNQEPPPELWKPGEMETSKGVPMPVILIILVTVLVVGTAILIKIFWKPNRNNM